MGEEAARQELIEHNLRLVVYIARRFENTGINIEDLISIGTIGLIKAMAKFNDIKFFLISPRELAVPEYMRVFMREHNMWYTEVTGLEPVIPQLDVLYMTRIQKERFVDPLEYERNKGFYLPRRILQFYQ